MENTKRITLIHSYSDFNKGDLGIILGTIYNLRRVNKDITINAISSFNFDDPFFKTHHNRLKKVVTEMYPAIIGRLFSKNLFYKCIKLFFETIKMISIYFLPIYLVKFFLNNEEKKTLEILKRSDIIISKGGSFICNKNNLIDKIRLIREMTIIVLSIRLEKKTFIWGQSIGPVYGKISIKLVNWILRRVNKVILREKLCMIEYSYLKFPKDIIQGYDLAFSLIHKKQKIKIDKNIIGFTIKRFSNEILDYTYTNYITELITYIVDKLSFEIFIIPHVTIDDDLGKAEEVFNLLDPKIQDKVKIDYEDYSINELIDIYGNLDLLIGTRLHSTIFALCANTKVINIGYHGTKSLGVFSKFGLENYQFDIKKHTLEDIKNATKKILKISMNYNEQVDIAREKNLEIAKEIML